jgi:hypothetical protein
MHWGLPCAASASPGLVPEPLFDPTKQVFSSLKPFGPGFWLDTQRGYRSPFASSYCLTG